MGKTYRNLPPSKRHNSEDGEYWYEPSKCPEHPDYQAIHKPSTGCKVCWEIWRKSK